MRLTEELVAAVADHFAGGSTSDEPACVLLKCSGGCLEIQLTFERGRRYCCCEPGCHLGLMRASDWHALRDTLQRVQVAVPATDLSLRVKGVVEPGALFAAFSSEPAEDCSYEHVFRESEANATR